MFVANVQRVLSGRNDGYAPFLVNIKKSQIDPSNDKMIAFKENFKNNGFYHDGREGTAVLNTSIENVRTLIKSE
jgi:hypothetical protein